MASVNQKLKSVINKNKSTSPKYQTLIYQSIKILQPKNYNLKWYDNNKSNKSSP